MDARDEDQTIHALMENMACRDELDWLTMCYYCEVKIIQKSTVHRCHLPIPLDYIKQLCKIAEMAAKCILPPTLKIILNIHYPLPVEQKSPIPLSSVIPLSTSPLPCAEPELLGDDQFESEEFFLEARADDTTEKKGKKEPERNNRYKREEVPLLQVFGKSIIQGKMEPERRVLETQRLDTGVEAPGQLHLSSRKTQRTAADGFTHADSSSKLERIFVLQAIIEIKPEKTTPQIIARQEIVILSMSPQ